MKKVISGLKPAWSGARYVHLMRCWLLTLSFLACSTLFSAPDSGEPVDTIEVKGGALLTGRIQAVEGDSLRLETDYAGLILVSVARIESISLGIKRDLDLPEDLLVFDQATSTAASTPAPAPAQAAPAKKETKPESHSWSFDAGLNIVGKEGNAERFDFTVTIDAELERKTDRINLYGRYAYGTNRDVTSTNEIIGGGRYTNFQINGIGLFVREEVERDEFEGINLRSTSAAGLSYQFKNEETLKIEARTGLSYRYEDYVDDGKQDYPGMDLGVDITWRFVKWARFKGSYTFLPSIDDFENFIFEQDSGVTLPLDKASLWSIRFGINSQYNNSPDGNRVKLDYRYYARLIATWN